MKKKYMIQLVGCDDTNSLTMELEDSEYEVIKKVATTLTNNSACKCEPTMGIFEVLKED